MMDSHTRALMTAGFFMALVIALELLQGHGAAEADARSSAPAPEMAVGAERG